MYQKIQKHLEVLNTKIWFFGRIKEEDHLSALDKIEELGTPHDTRYLIHLVFSGRASISQKAATTVRRLLIKTDVETAWLKLYGSYSYCHSYGLLEKLLIKMEHFTPEERAHLYGVASLSPSGYVREKALAFLEGLPTHETLPYILLRLNDWVPQVQSKALTALEKVLPSISAMDLMKYSDLIEWLGRTKRVNLTGVQKKILMQINSARNREDLLMAMHKYPVRKRLLCWKAFVEEIKDGDMLIEKAIVDPAPEIRQLVVDHIPQDENKKSRLRILLSDSAIRVRYSALKACAQDTSLRSKEFFENAIFDDSKPIREYARFMLRSNSCTDHAYRYRAKILELKSEVSPGIVAGLSETGTKEDIPLIMDYVDHKNPKIRASALTGLNRLGVDGIDRLCVQGLQDVSAKVRNTSVSILQNGYGYLVPEFKELLATRSVKIQKSVLKVLIKYEVLSSLHGILFALASSNGELRKAAWDYLVSWHHQHKAKLWFNFDNRELEQVVKLHEKIRKRNDRPPSHAQAAWKDLPSMLMVIKGRS